MSDHAQNEEAEAKPSLNDYLGDGVYAGFDGFQIWLTTQEGDRIAIEPSVLRALMSFAKRINATFGVNHFTVAQDHG